MVGALQTFGSQIQWNPHVHSLVSDGLFLEGGEFIALPLWSEDFEELLTETLRCSGPFPLRGSVVSCSTNW